MLAALEVSTRISSVALLDLITGEELAGIALPGDPESSVTLLPALETLLKDKDLSPSDLAAVAVSTGPGSFTGIRVGIATAEGLCLPGNLLAFGIPTLDGLAENLRAAGLTGEALCLIDAQRGEVFAGHYRIDDQTIE
ncbi:MAG TPA: tRNA (adenosine(37)-N6)-threonylcarbamoyltransferase complex dimerization subunit type 1 TsaB, partial [bacterium]|nr:tRNA (adenosine(37)-N6)-threonylcarbamoyltransferase complex dimerization subunit type 1 TsaB [bacterium]